VNYFLFFILNVWMVFSFHLSIIALTSKSIGQMVNYRKGEYLANSHDINNWVFFLDQGLVSVGFNSENGDGKLIGYFIPGMTFAQSGSFF
jgi:CRP-like cAMP-binding protein